ncbi:MAG: hypothetical protein JSV45_05030 [Chromatiales bacterium]|nr:MAG: hypothetical protein JSV45_05030 [Chromatiales bacterium]
MFRSVFFIVILLGSTIAQADANRGELGGFRLGDAYALDDDSAWTTAADRSLKIAATAATKPADIDMVYLYATPASHTIGKIVYHSDFDSLGEAEQAAEKYRAQLESDYPDWERLRAPIPMGKAGGAMVSRLRNGPHALIVFYRGTADGAELAVELEYESASPERKAWKQQLKQELGAP